jgi:(S)-sulfolactate dehydrogenase
MAGARLGLLGFGATAREVAWRARAFDMTVAAFDPMIPADDPRWHAMGVTPLSVAALLAGSDVISLHVPLTPQTHHVINAAAIAQMKPGAVLVNAARGGVVDEAALVAALRDGRLGGAALDVFETEPLDAAAGARLADVPNLILTPHIAGVTQESNLRVSHVTVKNVLDVLGAA